MKQLVKQSLQIKPWAELIWCEKFEVVGSDPRTRRIFSTVVLEVLNWPQIKKTWVKILPCASHTSRKRLINF